MPESEDPEAVRSRRQRLDLLYAAHVALVLVLGAGWALRTIEDAGASSETSFASSTAGRTLALLAMLLGIGAIVVVVVGTILERRNARILLLLALLLGAFWSRTGPDLADLAYSIVAVTLSVAWFCYQRTRRRAVD